MDEKKTKGLYLVTVEWYDECQDKDRTNYALVIAKDIGKAIEKVSKDFDYINTIKAEEWISGGSVNVNCIYIPDDWNLIYRIKNENDY